MSQVRYLNRSLTSGLFTNVNCAYMSNKLDKAGYLLYLRRTTVLFKIIVRGVQVIYEDSRMQRSS